MRGHAHHQISKLTCFECGTTGEWCWDCSEGTPAPCNGVCGTVEQACCDRCHRKHVAKQAAKSLRAIPSEARTEKSRENGKLGGRPRRYILIDDLGRTIGDTVTAPGWDGEKVEYGYRDNVQNLLRVDGIARLRKAAKSDPLADRRYDVA